MLDRFAIARALREIGALLELKGENPFKARAYDNGARAVEKLSDEDLGRLVDEKRLTEVKGIGDALAAQIAELQLTGRSLLLDELRAVVPPDLLELAQVPELGPRKIQQLREALGIASVAALKTACEMGQVRALKGFGEKSEANILAGITDYERRQERMLLVHALELGEPLRDALRSCPHVVDVALAGSVRRWKETVADLDLVVASSDASAVMDAFVAYPTVSEVIERGTTKCAVRLRSGLQVDLRVVPREDFATALHHFTGAKEHHLELRGRARALGLTVSEWGVARIDDGQKLAIPTEVALYGALGLPYIPPELREGTGEIDAALGGERFDDLVTLDDIQGMVHCHTTWSDGKGSIEEMARAAEALGMKYLTITDHSQAAVYAGGLKVDALKRQWDEIARVQERVEIRLLRGTESDILDDGMLDYPDEVLDQLDVVIASIHSRMKMDEDAMTRRLVTAMQRPQFKIWGHALGRLLLKREPFACRVEEVLDAVAASRAAIEVNGDPYRLDMEPRWINAARRRGIRFVISTDAHSPQGLKNLRFGVGIARRGGLRASEVLNARDVVGFQRAVRPR